MVSPDALIALDFTFVPLVICLTIARQYILRHREPTPASVISDASLIMFTLCIVAIGSLELRNDFLERGLRKRYGNDDKQVQIHLLTPTYAKINFAALILYTLQLWLLKAAYLGYFFRVANHLTVWTRRLLIITTVYAAVGFIVAMVLQLTYCHPLRRNWSTGPDACVSLSTIVGSTVQAWLNLTADLMVLAIAILAVMSLQMGKNERTALIFVVALGSVSPLMCLLRFVAVYKVAADPSPSGGVELGVIREIYLWGKFEVCFAHIAFCLPALRVFIRWTRERTSQSDKMKGLSSSGQSSDIRRRYSQGGPRRIEDDLGVATPESEIELDPMNNKGNSMVVETGSSSSPSDSGISVRSEEKMDGMVSRLSSVVTAEDAEFVQPQGVGSGYGESIH